MRKEKRKDKRDVQCDSLKKYKGWGYSSRVQHFWHTQGHGLDFQHFKTKQT
jgi:hypothetical protein